METKHTPGPWRANGPTGPNMQSYSQPFCVAGTGDYACTLIAGCFGDTRGGIEAAEANARLIAAAPELLALAQRVAALNENCAEIGHGMLTQLVTEARTAIAKSAA